MTARAARTFASLALALTVALTTAPLALAQSPPTGAIVWDTFTGTGSLAAHVPDVRPSGAVWSVIGSGTPSVQNGVVATTGSGVIRAGLSAATGANGTVGVDVVTTGTGSRYGGLLLRVM